MSESFGTDSPLRGWTMPKAYSGDLRERVIEAVEHEGRRGVRLPSVSASVRVRGSSGCSAGTRLGAPRLSRAEEAYRRWRSMLR